MRAEEQQDIWDSLYKSGYAANYTWSIVVSTFMNRRIFGSLGGKSVLEYGCGPATNMPFFSDVGMRAFGFDFSQASISNGAARLIASGHDVIVAEDGFDEFRDRPPASVTLAVSDFQSFQSKLQFDYVLDRGALCCIPPSELPEIIQKIRGNLSTGGLFMFTPFTDRDPANPAHRWAQNQEVRSLGEFYLSYLSYNDVVALLAEPEWTIERLREISEIDPVTGEGYRQWLVVARKR